MVLYVLVWVKYSEFLPVPLVGRVGCHQFFHVVHVHMIGGESLADIPDQGFPRHWRHVSCWYCCWKNRYDTTRSSGTFIDNFTTVLSTAGCYCFLSPFPKSQHLVRAGNEALLKADARCREFPNKVNFSANQIHAAATERSSCGSL